MHPQVIYKDLNMNVFFCEKLPKKNTNVEKMRSKNVTKTKVFLWFCNKINFFVTKLIFVMVQAVIQDVKKQNFCSNSTEHQKS